MTDHPTRAPWWREVTDPTEVVEAGCPLRYEVGERCFPLTVVYVPEDDA